MERQEIYEKLLIKWEHTGKVGPVFCNTRAHAQRVAFMASKSIEKQNNKIKQLKINTLSLPCEGTEPFTGNGQCVQLGLFSINKNII